MRTRVDATCGKDILGANNNIREPASLPEHQVLEEQSQPAQAEATPMQVDEAEAGEHRDKSLDARAEIETSPPEVTSTPRPTRP